METASPLLGLRRTRVLALLGPAVAAPKFRVAWIFFGRKRASSSAPLRVPSPSHHRSNSSTLDSVFSSCVLLRFLQYVEPFPVRRLRCSRFLSSFFSVLRVSRARSVQRFESRLRSRIVRDRREYEELEDF